jgi:hypothetical protein
MLSAPVLSLPAGTLACGLAPLQRPPGLRAARAARSCRTRRRAAGTPHAALPSRTSAPQSRRCARPRLGGTYADGTYVLTAETLYQSGNCVPGSPVSQTLLVAAGCEQWAGTSGTGSDGGANSTTGSTTVTVQGNQIVGCELGTESFTATAMTLTLYYPCDSGDPNCVAADVYTKQ